MPAARALTSASGKCRRVRAAVRYPRSMNRQLRRAQQQADDKKDKEKVRARRAKRKKREAVKARRAAPKRSDTKASSSGSTRRRPDLFYRFAGVITLFTTAFILLQAVTPRPEESTFTLAVEAAYYFIFGYGLVLWLTKQGRANALPLTIGAGLLLAVVAQGITFFIPGLVPDWRLLAIGSGLVVAGTFFGRWVGSRMA
jgi:hypothetical protein